MLTLLTHLGGGLDNDYSAHQRNDVGQLLLLYQERDEQPATPRAAAAGQLDEESLEDVFVDEVT